MVKSNMLNSSSSEWIFIERTQQQNVVFVVIVSVCDETMSSYHRLIVYIEKLS